jgi:hypothetical protein
MEMTVGSYAGSSRSDAPGTGGAGDGGGPTSWRRGMGFPGWSAPSSPNVLPEKI